MSKKERNKEAPKEVSAVEMPVEVREPEPLLEADAYGTPQPDAGSEVTVMKQVGIGGPVPIVAPKHNTIQLQPIIVPLAVVPYMTQDSNVLRTDGRSAQAGYAVTAEEYVEAARFERVDEKPEKKKRRWQPRVFSLITLLLSALVLLPIIYSYFEKTVGGSDIYYFNIIGAIEGWVKSGFNIKPVTNIVYIAVALFAAIVFVCSFIGLIIGKYPKILTAIMSFINGACFIGVLIYMLVRHEFNVSDDAIFLVLLIVSLLEFLLAIIFTLVLNKLEDEDETRKNVNREI